MKLMIKTKILNPPLKWAGGKRWLVPQLEQAWNANQDRRLVEPFSGGLAVALGLQPQCALLNDINPHLINFYIWLKNGLTPTKPFINECDNKKEVYYENRAKFNELVKTETGLQSSEAALLFYYLNRTGYNGLCRFNRKGEFNVPFGSHKTINYLSNFEIYREAFTNWEFCVGDFTQLPIDKNDFIYADPPYDVEFVSYSKEGFSFDDQKRLAKWLVEHKGPVIISNQATARMKIVYRKFGYKLKPLSAPRRISSDGDRTPADEILAYKNVQFD